MCSRPTSSFLRLSLVIGLIFGALRCLLPAAAPSQEALNQALLDLGSGDFAVREAATRLLWQHASLADALLEEARTSADPEVRMRAERIWGAYQLGILPDTPRSVVEQIYEFHDGSIQQKQSIINQLVAEDNLNTAFRLLRSIEDDNLRNGLAEIVANQVRAKLLPHLLKQEWDQAEQILKSAALGDLGMRDYATFVLLTGRLEEAMAEHAQDRRLQMWLLRASGNMEEAIKMAEGDDELERELRAASGDALAYCQAELAEPSAAPVQELRAQAFHARLTDNQPAFDQAIKDLLELVKNEDDGYGQRFAIRALLLNDVVDPVLPFLPKLVQQTVYDIQSYRGMYADALKRLGIEKQQPPYEAWVEERCQAIVKNAEESDALQEIVDLAHRMHDMGEVEEATRMLGRAFEATEKDIDRRQALVTNELQIGVRELAEKHLRILSESGIQIDELQEILPVPPEFRNLSGDFKNLLTQWYDFILKQEDAPADRLEALLQAWKIVGVQDPDAKPRPEIPALLDSAHRSAAILDPKDRTTILYNLYLTAALHEDTERMADYLEELVKLTGGSTYYFSLGNTHGQRQAWDDAARAYEQAWQINRAAVAARAAGTAPNARPQQNGRETLQPKYLYLAGMAHRKAGSPEKGAAMIDQARLLCLGDLGMRYVLTMDMSEHGDDDLAEEEWALIARLSKIDEPVGTAAFYFLSDTLSKKDPAKAAGYHERVIVARDALDRVFPNAQLFTFDIRLRSQVHQWQTKAHLLAGKTQAALESLKRYWQLTPGNASIGEELLPLLEEAGREADAEAYYEKTRAFAEEACRIFPKSAMAHNNLAWLDSRSRRKLDEALKHAETAVRLQPDTAAYLDTLAEVHFAMGDREKALELSARAVELTPQDKELLGQRERFENAPLPAKRDPE